MAEGDSHVQDPISTGKGGSPAAPQSAIVRGGGFAWWELGSKKGRGGGRGILEKVRKGNRGKGVQGRKGSIPDRGEKPKAFV